MTKKTKRVDFELSEDKFRIMEAEKDRMKVNRSELMRLIIDDYINRNKLVEPQRYDKKIENDTLTLTIKIDGFDSSSLVVQ